METLAIFKSIIASFFVSGSLFSFTPIMEDKIEEKFTKNASVVEENEVKRQLQPQAEKVLIAPKPQVLKKSQPKVTTQSQVTKVQKNAAPTKQQAQPKQQVKQQVVTAPKVEAKPKAQAKAVQQKAQPKQQAKPPVQTKAVQQQAQPKPKQQSKPPVTTKQVSQTAPPTQQKFKNDTDMSDAEYEAYLKKHGVDMSEPESVSAIIGVNAERGQVLFSD